jgi:DNA-binding phage protein
MKSADAVYIADAIGIVARQRGIGQIAEQAVLNGQALYSTLSAGGPQSRTSRSTCTCQETASTVHPPNDSWLITRQR